MSHPSTTPARNEPPTVSALWTVHECAAYLKKSTRWLWREIARGSVPHVRVGKSPRFYPEEIDAWLRSGCRNAAALRAQTFSKN